MSGLGLELHEACSVGDYDSLEEYLKSGKHDINLRDPEFGNRMAIHWAAQKGHVDCLRILMDHGAPGDAKMDMGWTPAHCAAEMGRLHILRALHVAGISLTMEDQYGDTPKMVADTYGHTECVNYLQQVEEENKQKSEESGETQEQSS